MTSPIPVTIVTGFLGAGKSTLVERWLSELPSDTAVIVNEAGTVGIDGELLAERATRLREITGGCVCCVTHVELDRTLAELAESSAPPSRILIETSGAASPAGVLRILTRGMAREELRLDGVVTVLDASRASETMTFALTLEQLGFADVVLLSHADVCDEAALDSLEHTVGGHAPGAVIARANQGALIHADADTLLGLLDARAGVLRIRPLHSDTTHQRIDAVSLIHPGELDEERFGDWVERALGAVEVRLLRIKGILAIRGVDDRVIVQGVSEAVEITFGAPWGDAERGSRLVILGLRLDEGALAAGFAACAADD